MFIPTLFRLDTCKPIGFNEAIFTKNFCRDKDDGGLDGASQARYVGRRSKVSRRFCLGCPGGADWCFNEHRLGGRRILFKCISVSLFTTATVGNKYQRHIDGLRAIAVLGVIFFHFGHAVFSGAYIGVDVFFVIGGLLIT